MYLESREVTGVSSHINIDLELTVYGLSIPGDTGHGASCSEQGSSDHTGSKQA
jgi:hypothetical protein